VISFLEFFLSGFLLGLSLILAIGPQNAFILKAGLVKRFVPLLCFICAASDAILIIAGVFGFGVIFETFPKLTTFIAYLGSAFLFFYGFFAIKSAVKGGKSLEADGVLETPLKAVTSCLLLTWLNPHVYLDTVVLLGSVANQSQDPLLFCMGAVAASFIFFFCLGFGASLLRPLFRNEKSWRILDIFVGLVMWSIAMSLILGNY